MVLIVKLCSNVLADALPQSNMCPVFVYTFGL